MPTGPELYIVIAVVLLLFGGSKLPQLARSLGQAKSEFKKGTEEGEAEASGTTVRKDVVDDTGTVGKTEA